MSRIRKREINRDKSVFGVTRNRTGKCEGGKRILETHPELETVVSKLRKKGLTYRKISEYLKEEYGYSVHYSSIGNILKDIEWMKKERRRIRRKSSMTESV